MTELEKNRIIMNGFYDELEKNAQVLPTVFKALRAVGGFFKNKLKTSGKLFNFADKGLAEFKTSGVQGLRQYVGAYRAPKFTKGGTGIIQNNSRFLTADGNKTKALENAKHVKDTGGWLQHQIAEKAEMFNNLKQGPSAVVKGFGQELRDARYKQVNMANATWGGKGKMPEAVWKEGQGAVIKGQGIMGDRKILNVAKDVKDQASLNAWIKNNPNVNPIVKKRLLMQGLTGSVTTPAMMGTPFVFGGLSGDSFKESLTAGVTNFIPGGWEARMGYDLLAPK